MTTSPPLSSSEEPALVSYVLRPLWLKEAEKHFNHVLTVLQLFGFSLNVFHLFVLTRKEMRSHTVYLLMLGICSFDLVSQVATILLWSPFLIRSPPRPEEMCFLTLTRFDVLTQVYCGPVLDVTQRNSSWLAVSMALFRTLSVMFPMSASMQKLSNPRVAVSTIIVILLVSVIWTLEVFSRFTVVPHGSEVDCNNLPVVLSETRYARIVPNDLQAAHNRIVSIYGALKALPAFIDLALALLLVIELRKATRRRQSIQKTVEKKPDNTTKLVLFMTISFFLLEVPNAFSHVAAGFTHDSIVIFSILYYIQVFAEILPILNSSSHVFVCLLMSSQYRESARGLLCSPSTKVIMVKESGTEAHPRGASHY